METLIKLIISARNGDDNAFWELCEKYNPLLISMAHKYAQMCIEEDLSDDFLQEAKMALYSAVMSFDIDQSKVTFGFYVKRCIRNRLVSCVRKANSKKRRQRNESDIESSTNSPQESVLQYELTKEILSLAEDILSQYEMEILKMYFSGLRAKEISAKIGKSEKSVNNAIYRIKSKLRGKINGGT